MDISEDTVNGFASHKSWFFQTIRETTCILHFVLYFHFLILNGIIIFLKNLIEKEKDL